MTEKNIRVTRWIDGEDRIVTVNDKILSESEIVDLLVEYMEENKELQQIIDTISKDYENSHGMDIRNAEWFTAW